MRTSQCTNFLFFFCHSSGLSLERKREMEWWGGTERIEQELQDLKKGVDRERELVGCTIV